METPERKTKVCCTVLQ